MPRGGGYIRAEERTAEEEYILLFRFLVVSIAIVTVRDFEGLRPVWSRR
jgi:hypothetical protein